MEGRKEGRCGRKEFLRIVDYKVKEARKEGRKEGTCGRRGGRKGNTEGK